MITAREFVDYADISIHNSVLLPHRYQRGTIPETKRFFLLIRRGTNRRSTLKADATTRFIDDFAVRRFMELKIELPIDIDNERVISSEGGLLTMAPKHPQEHQVVHRLKEIQQSGSWEERDNLDEFLGMEYSWLSRVMTHYEEIDAEHTYELMISDKLKSDVAIPMEKGSWEYCAKRIGKFLTEFYGERVVVQNSGGNRWLDGSGVVRAYLKRVS